MSATLQVVAGRSGLVNRGRPRSTGRERMVRRLLDDAEAAVTLREGVREHRAREHAERKTKPCPMPAKPQRSTIGAAQQQHNGRAHRSKPSRGSRSSTRAVSSGGEDLPPGEPPAALQALADWFAVWAQCNGEPIELTDLDRFMRTHAVPAGVGCWSLLELLPPATAARFIGQLSDEAEARFRAEMDKMRGAA